MGRWQDIQKQAVAEKEGFESMEIAVPKTLEIKASGVAIGEMYMFGANSDLYVATKFKQKFDLVSFHRMMVNYWGHPDRGRTIQSMIVDFEDSDILIYLDPKEKEQSVG